MKTPYPILFILVLVITKLFILGGCGEYESWTNDPPEINTFTVPKEVRYGESVELKVGVSDPEKDDLTYTWEVSGGTLEGEGASIEWTAPKLRASEIAPDQTIKVHVSVRDDGEETISKSGTITVYSKSYRVAKAYSGSYQLIRTIVDDETTQAVGSMRLTTTTFTREYEENNTFFYGAYKLIEPFDDQQGTIYWYSNESNEPVNSTYTWDGALFIIFWTATNTSDIYQKVN